MSCMMGTIFSAKFKGPLEFIHFELTKKISNEVWDFHPTDVTIVHWLILYMTAWI